MLITQALPRKLLLLRGELKPLVTQVTHVTHDGRLTVLTPTLTQRGNRSDKTGTTEENSITQAEMTCHILIMD